MPVFVPMNITSAKGKTHLKIGQCVNIFEKLDVDLMNKATAILMEYNDFETFSKANNNHNHYLCDLFRAEWVESDSEYVFYIKANRFVRSMVRMIVGTLVDVGRYRISLDEFREIIESKDRTQSGRVMPAHGLYFTGAGFDEEKLILLK
jgi:tRNA pseudouridine38-40 synthase